MNFFNTVLLSKDRLLTCNQLSLSLLLIGCLSNEDGNDNGKCKKSNRLNRQNNNFARAIHFLYISLLSLHDYDIKLPNLMFCGGCDEKIFLSLSELGYWFLRIKLQKSLTK